MEFSFRKLSGKIKEVCGTQEVFAEKLEISEHSLSNKLNGKTPFKQAEILKACNILGIGTKEIHDYFFSLKSSEN